MSGVAAGLPSPTQYTSWAFGKRLRAAGLLGSMGTVGDAYDNAVAESFFATLQLELLDRQPRWSSREQLASAIFDYIESFYNRTRRHSSGTGRSTGGSLRAPLRHVGGPALGGDVRR